MSEQSNETIGSLAAVRVMKASGIDTSVCFCLTIVGCACVCIFLVSLFLNASLLWIFYNKKQLLSPVNMFMVTLTLLNLIGTCVELPTITVNNFNCKWVWPEQMCTVTGFLMYFIGCSSVFIMCAISLERLFILSSANASSMLTRTICIWIIVVCLCLGIVWPVAPLLGWSWYSLEGAKTSCAVEWSIRSPSVTSYNITIFVVVFLVPFSLILVTNMVIIYKLKKLRKDGHIRFKGASIKARIMFEQRITVSIIIVLVGFMISWLPYSFTSMYTAFVDSNGVSPIAGTLCGIFAKSSMVWSPLSYMTTCPNVRAQFKSLLKRPSESNDQFSRRNNLVRISSNELIKNLLSHREILAQSKTTNIYKARENGSKT